MGDGAAPLPCLRSTAVVAKVPSLSATRGKTGVSKKSQLAIMQSSLLVESLESARYEQL